MKRVLLLISHNCQCKQNHTTRKFWQEVHSNAPGEMQIAAWELLWKKNLNCRTESERRSTCRADCVTHMERGRETDVDICSTFLRARGSKVFLICVMSCVVIYWNLNLNAWRATLTSRITHFKEQFLLLKCAITISSLMNNYLLSSLTRKLNKLDIYFFS